MSGVTWAAGAPTSRLQMNDNDGRDVYMLVAGTHTYAD